MHDLKLNIYFYFQKQEAKKRRHISKQKLQADYFGTTITTDSAQEQKWRKKKRQT